MNCGQNLLLFGKHSRYSWNMLKHADIIRLTSAHVCWSSAWAFLSVPRKLNCSKIWLRMRSGLYTQYIPNISSIHSQYILNQCAAYALLFGDIRNWYYVRINGLRQCIKRIYSVSFPSPLRTTNWPPIKQLSIDPPGAQCIRCVRNTFVMHSKCILNTFVMLPRQTWCFLNNCAIHAVHFRDTSGMFALHSWPFSPQWHSLLFVIYPLFSAIYLLYIIDMSVIHAEDFVIYVNFTADANGNSKHLSAMYAQLILSSVWPGL